MIEPVDVGIKVGLEMLGADCVVYPVDSPLDVAPHTLNVVGVGPSRYVFFGRVVDRLVGVSKACPVGCSYGVRQCRRWCPLRIYAREL